MGDETRDEDEIEWSVTNYLIGDVYITAQRVTCFRPHPSIFAHSQHRRQAEGINGHLGLSQPLVTVG